MRVQEESDATVCDVTRRLSLNPKSTFCLWFRIPLYKVKQMCTRLLSEKILTLSQHCCSEDRLAIKCVHEFRQIPTLANINVTKHSNFFKRFVQFIYNMRSEYIYLPMNKEELLPVMKLYKEVGLPGCIGSVDVVYVTWSNCPAGVLLLL